MTIQIDAHVHIWDLLDNTYPVDAAFGPPPKMDAPLEVLLRLMDDHEVSNAVLIQPGCYGFDASLIVDISTAYPDRFLGMGMVDPRSPDVADALDYWTQRGLVGMRVLGDWFNAPYLELLWRKAFDLGVSLSFLTGPVDLSPLANLLNRLPPTNIILDHFGHRRFEDRSHCQQLLDLAQFPTVYVKTSGLYALSSQHHPHSDAAWLIEAVFQEFGPKRMMWASDFPYIQATCGYRPCLELFRDEISYLDEEDREWICGKTAAALFLNQQESRGL